MLRVAARDVSSARQSPIAREAAEPVIAILADDAVKKELGLAPHGLAQALVEIGEQLVVGRERRDIEAFLPGDTFDDLSISTSFQDISEDLILLPIWIFAYSYRGRIYRFVLNGSTGKSTGKKPISWARVALAASGALFLLGLVLLAIALLTGGH